MRGFSGLGLGRQGGAGARGGVALVVYSFLHRSGILY
jgi:hypothetical protein